MASLIGVRIVSDAKLIDYLLDIDHPTGGPKARFFTAFGFSPQAPDVLANALLLHADTHPIHTERAHERGVNRVIRCRIATPDGRDPCIKTIWIQENGKTTQRFVTAYPE